MSLEELKAEKKKIESVLYNLNNVSQKALGLAQGARENLTNQKNEWSDKLAGVNEKINELLPRPETRTESRDETTQTINDNTGGIMQTLANAVKNPYVIGLGIVGIGAVVLGSNSRKK